MNKEETEILILGDVPSDLASLKDAVQARLATQKEARARRQGISNHLNVDAVGA